MKIVRKNILNATEDIICQQVNCKGVMGAGLAKQIKEKYPEVFDSYKELTYQTTNLLGQAQVIKCNDGKYVANLFGQKDYGTHKQQTDYDALGMAFNRLFSAVTNINEYMNKSIAIPYGIGCGLGGGDWNIVLEIIEKCAKAYNYTNYTFYSKHIK